MNYKHIPYVHNKIEILLVKWQSLADEHPILGAIKMVEMFFQLLSFNSISKIIFLTTSMHEKMLFTLVYVCVFVCVCVCVNLDCAIKSLWKTDCILYKLALPANIMLSDHNNLQHQQNKHGSNLSHEVVASSILKRLFTVNSSWLYNTHHLVGSLNNSLI